MREKEEKTTMKSKHSIGASSCYLSITPQKDTMKDAICQVCDRVFKTKGDSYICLDCLKKANLK